MRVGLPLGFGVGAVIIEIAAAITSPGDVDVVPLVVLCVVTLVVTSAAVAGAQWLEHRQANRTITGLEGKSLISMMSCRISVGTRRCE